MSDIKIYHNPRCSKSRIGVQLLEDAKVSFDTILYLKEVPSTQEIKDLLKKLDIPAINLIRKGEKDWKENFKGKDLNEDEIIEAMSSYPKLIERPIVVKGDKAVIGRPAENISELIKGLK
jgi:arsenate reductase